MISGVSEPLQQIDRTHVLWRGRKLVYFGGCDYLRLSFHPAIRRALRETLARYGLNVSASRRTTGNHMLYEEVESATARFFGAERALFVSNGYLTNIALAQGLKGSIGQAFIDERAHSSLRDAAIFLGCTVTEFRHRDAQDLRVKIREVSNSKRAAVLTDGIFANDGSVAPLAAYREACGPETLLWVDDAHAAGVLGTHGRGSIEWAGLSRRNVIQTITFSKAFGVYGGAILCDRARAAGIMRTSAVLTGNTPAPLPLVGAVLKALEIARDDTSLREKLRRNIALFWEKLGVKRNSQTAIIAVTARSPGALKSRLLKNGIHPPFIQYGGGPASQYFRFALSTAHSAEQIKRLARTLAASPNQISQIG